MAYQGLFTQGPSVDDLLEQRNKRATDLQQTLMANAGKRARDPAKAQAISFLGSTLGRALGNASGGADTELQQAEQRETTEAGLVSQYAKAASGTDVAAMYTSANEMINYGDPKSIQMGSSLLQRADQLKAGQQAAETARQVNAEKELERLMQDEANYELSESIRPDNEALADQVAQGRPKAIELAMEIMSPENKDKVSKQGSYKMPDGKIISGFVKGTARFQYGDNGDYTPMPTSAVWIGEAPNLSIADQKLVTFKSEAQKIKELVTLGPDKGGVSEIEGADMLDNIKSALGMEVDANRKETKKEDAQNMSGYLTDAIGEKKGSGRKLASLQQSIAMLDAGMYTGTGAGAIQAVRKLAIATGIADVDTEIKAANVEQFRANVMDAILDRIALTKGAISEKEMTAFAKASIGLDRTVAGNRLLLETATRSEKWISDRSSFINDTYTAARKKGKLLKRFEMVEKVKEWEETNQLVLPTAQEIADAKSAGNISTSGSVLTGKETNQELIDLATNL